MDEERPWLEENPNCAQTHVSFRIIGDMLDPDIITARLGLVPDTAGRKGQVRAVNPRTGRKYYYRTGIWIISTAGKLDSTSLERHLSYLLDILKPVKPELDRLLDEFSLRTDFFAFWVSRYGQGGPILSPEIMRRMADLPIPFGLDIYFGNDTEE